MRKVTAALIALVTFFAGGVLGAYFMRELCRMTLLSYDMANVDHLASYIKVQRYAGTPEAYEAALHDYLIVLDQRERVKHSPLFRNDSLFSGNIERVDRVLTYVRLSVLAAQRGLVDEAAKYQKQAVAACPQSQWKSCGWERLSALVQKLDVHSEWNPSKPTPSYGS